MRGKCERRGGDINADAAGANVIQRKAKGYAGPPMASCENCERRRGCANADAANAEVFVCDGCSQGASFGPMAAISRRWRGGHIYNNTRTRERLRRKCVKPADLTTHSPSKICSRPPHSDTPFPNIFSPPSRTLPLPLAATMHAHRPHNIPRRRYSPCPSTFSLPSRTLPLPLAAPTHTRRLRDAHPPTSQHFPRRRSAPAPAAPPCLPLRSTSGTKKRHRTVDVRCRMSRSTVVAVGHLGW